MPRAETQLKGLTLTEMLAVVAIMLILSYMAVVTVVRKLETARIRRAHADCKEIANAEIACAAIHGFLVPIQVLDDVQYVQGVTDIYDDSIRNEPPTAINLIDMNVRLSPIPFQWDLSDRQVPRVSRLYFYWQGPFLRTKDVFIGDAASDDPDDLRDAGVEQYFDFPLDPWGQPYRLYSPIGIVGTNALLTNPQNWENLNFSDGRLTTIDDRFDRFAIVSFGPDGEPNSSGNAQSADDIIYTFGYPTTETSFNIF